MTDPAVRNNKARGRFEIDMGGSIAFLDYRIEDGRIIMPHTVVPREHRGRGYGGLLVRTALDYARREKLEVVALCSFVAGFIERHPEYRNS